MSCTRGTWAALGLGLLMSACGGNGGGGGSEGGVTVKIATTPVVNGVSEGAWSGSTTKRDTLDMLLLEDGSFYAMFRADIPGSPPDLAFAQGSYSFSGVKFAASGKQYNAVDQSTGSLDGMLRSEPPDVGLSGDIINSGGRAIGSYGLKPTSTVDPNYNYNQSASLADVAGAWSSAVFMGETGSYLLSIDKDSGAVSVSSLGCAITGKLIRRSSGKNVFDVSLRFGFSCPHANTEFSGVALSYIAANTKRQFIAALQDASKTQGAMLFAQR